MQRRHCLILYLVKWSAAALATPRPSALSALSAVNLLLEGLVAATVRAALSAVNPFSLAYAPGFRCVPK